MLLQLPVVFERSRKLGFLKVGSQFKSYLKKPQTTQISASGPHQILDYVLQRRLGSRRLTIFPTHSKDKELALLLISITSPNNQH